MRKFFLIIYFVLIFCSCKNESSSSDDYDVYSCPDEISSRAFSFAELYRDSDTEYVWGSQDPVRAIAIDCSGLVVMCYKYAVVDTDYKLLFNDAPAASIYSDYSTKTENPRQGDLVFMGESGSTSITHIAILDKIENGYVYFIDSTQKDTDNDGIDDINGVTERSYATTDDKIKSYGVMNLGI